MVRGKRMSVLLAAVLSTSIVSAATTGFDQTGAGPWDYNDPANWVGGVINGTWDSSLTLTAAQVVTFGADTPLSAMSFYQLGNFSLSFRADGTGNRTVTLGGNLVANHPTNQTVQFGTGAAGQQLGVNLGGATRSFEVIGGGNKYLTFSNAMSGTNPTDGIIKLGGGTMNLVANNTYTGQSIANGGTLVMVSTGRSPLSQGVVNSGGTIRFDNATHTTASVQRLQSLRLQGGTLLANNNTGTNTNDLVGDVTIAGGTSTVTITPASTRWMRVTGESLSREAGGVALLRGTNLGTADIAPGTANTAYLVFNNAPTLSGGDAGTTSAGIIKGAHGDIVSGGNGAGLVTYDAARGVRLLDVATEYAPSLTSGQGTGATPVIENIRLANSSGTGVITTTLNEETVVNSLSLIVSGANTVDGSGLRVEGTGPLKITSGVVYAHQSVSGLTGTGNANNKMTLAAPIDLNGGEGVFISMNNGINNGESLAPLSLAGSIGNDGGAGITLGGTGIIYYEGTGHTYTGPTYGSATFLRILSALPGDLVVSSGTTQNTGHRVPDTADILVRGGALLQKGGATNSGSGAHETFRDLRMTNGTFTLGADGTSSGTTNLRNASIEGGAWNMTKGHKLNVSGDIALAGGAMRVDRANNASNTTILTVNGDIAISNIDSGHYRPLTVVGGSAADVPAGQVILGGNVYFTGNAINAYPTTIDATTPGAGGAFGTIALNGVRTFEIGDGAATLDLVVAPVLGNNGATEGGLTKTGPGTLALAAANTFTGPTTILGGTLALTPGGSLASAEIEIGAGAVLDTTLQDLVLTSGQTFRFGIEGNAAGSILTQALDVTDGVIDFVTVGTLGAESYVLASYSSLIGTFAPTNVSNLPENYELVYGYEGDNIALVVVPEPGTMGLALLTGAAIALRRRRGRDSR